MSLHASPLILGTEKIPKLLIRYAVPAIIAMTASSLYNLVDSIFIGQGVNSLALSGLAITMPLMNMGAAFGALIGIGSATLLSIKLGQQDKKSANMILGNVVILTSTLGILYTLLFLPFLDPVLYFFGASDATIGFARDYMFIILAGNVITHVYLGLNDLLRASGYPGRAMAVMLTAVILNCLLDALFIFTFGWGIAGAAWATLIAQIVALALELLHFSNKKSFIHFKPGIFRLKMPLVRGIFSIGMAPFLLYLCSSLIIILLNKSLKEYGGDLYIGAYSIVNRVAMLFVMIVMGLNQGMQPIVGYNYGARNYARVTRTLKYVVLCAVSVTTLGFVVCELFPNFIARLFTPDEQLIEIAAHGLRIVLMFFPIVGFQIVTSSFFQSIGKAHKAIFLSLTRQVIFLIPFLFLMSGLYGVTGVWISMPMADAMASILSVILLLHQLRQFRTTQPQPATNHE